MYFDVYITYERVTIIKRIYLLITPKSFHTLPPPPPCIAKQPLICLSHYDIYIFCCNTYLILSGVFHST